MNQTEFFSQLDTILREATNAKLKKKLDKLRDLLLEYLDPAYHAVALEVLDLHRYDARTILKLNATRKIRTKRDIDPVTRCMARIGLGNQCSRSRTSSSSVYCKSHYLSRPYGRIDVSEPPEKKMAKRRGRRSRSDKDYTIEDLDMDRYVQAIFFNINDEPYLMDQNNVLYQFNSNNEIVGHIVDGKVEWY
jgi:hypothetical protein